MNFMAFEELGRSFATSWLDRELIASLKITVKRVRNSGFMWSTQEVGPTREVGLATTDHIRMCSVTTDDVRKYATDTLFNCKYT